MTTATGVAELLSRAQEGERDAFTELVERHHAELVRICYAVTGDLDAARDSAQIAWMKAWQKLPSVREPDRLRAWLIAIAANEARQQVRSGRRRQVREIAPLAPYGTAASPTEMQTADRLDLSAALAGLNAVDRQLLAMRYLAGLTADEIGSAVGLAPSSVRSRISRLMQQLREDLGQ